MPDTALRELGEHVSNARPDCVLGYHVTNGELTVDVAPAAVRSLVEFLKTDKTCRFTTLVDITAVDYPAREARFDLVYHFLSMWQNHRIRLKTQIR